MAETYLFAIRTNVNLYNTHSRPNRSYSLTRFHLSPRLPVFSAYSLFAEQVSPLMSERLVLCPISSGLVLRLQFPLPLGGGGQKKKPSGEGCLCTTGSLPSWCLIVSVKERIIPSLVSYPLRLCPKKKIGGGGKTTHASCNCYAASSSASAVPTATSMPGSIC